MRFKKELYSQLSEEEFLQALENDEDLTLFKSMDDLKEFLGIDDEDFEGSTLEVYDYDDDFERAFKDTDQIEEN